MKSSLIFILTALVFISCKREKCIDIEGPRVSKSTNIESVNKITLDMVATLNLSVDSNNSLRAEKIAQEEMQKKIILEQDSNELFIFLEECYKENLPVFIDLDLHTLRTVSVFGAGDILSDGLIEEDTLIIYNDGLGTVDFAVASEYINGTIKSSGDVQLRGASESMEFKVIGSGKLDAYNLQAENVTVNTFSLGVVEVYATNRLRVNFIKPGGTVKYRGNPEGILITGTGTVINDNL